MAQRFGILVSALIFLADVRTSAVVAVSTSFGYAVDSVHEKPRHLTALGGHMIDPTTDYAVGVKTCLLLPILPIDGNLNLAMPFGFKYGALSTGASDAKLKAYIDNVNNIIALLCHSQRL